MPSGIELFQLNTALTTCPRAADAGHHGCAQAHQYGLDLEALAIATIAETPAQSAKIVKLPNLPGIAETDVTKLAVCRAWLRCWTLGQVSGSPI